MNRMFLLTEYPDDVLPLYAQGYSVCRFLIDQQGPQAFIRFLEGYMQHPSWTDNIRDQYGYDSLAELQDYWLAWVAAGSGSVDRFVKSNASPAAESTAPSIASRDLQLEQTSRPLNALANANAGANTTEAGWYLRRRMGGQQGSSIPASLNIAQVSATQEVIATPVPEQDPSTQAPLKTSAPPSVKRSGYYSAAQPQPEQSFSGGDFSRRGYSAQSIPTEIVQESPENNPVKYSAEPYYYGGQNSPIQTETGHFWR